jgi:hypothetical protein
MKTRFRIFIFLLLIGAASAGYWSGNYDGVRQIRIETQMFLRDFARSTDVEGYLQQHGQQEWVGRLRAYGIGGPTSYIHYYGGSVYAVLAGIACVAVGLVGLLRNTRLKPGNNEMPQAPPNNTPA